ncbi:arsenosugar biosynthesis radical SAM protein ArsS [bacterium AH-315-C07]|nr:arsenosugar biosynthesis radical SAM protein ArsS [bacterium AH-315-C07]
MLLKSLKHSQSKFSDTKYQLDLLSSENISPLPVFKEKLSEAELFPLKATGIEILQINLGYMCNITCNHCHVDAGPDRKEIMTQDTLNECLKAIDSSDIKIADLTGGAPEMHPDFKWFVKELTTRKCEVIVRSNLAILVANNKFRTFPAFLAEHNVKVIASLPCYTKENTDNQRGDGVFAKSIEALHILNDLGYGKNGSELELHLVFNPGGASLPPGQKKLEGDYKRELKENFDVEFNELYTITNLPISRFLEFLVNTNRLMDYMNLLVNSFNAAAAQNVMCRNTLSVGWDGKLFDCDFNQMLDLSIEDTGYNHIEKFNSEILDNRQIVVNQHCFGCTAGAGSSCQGSLV